MRLEAVHDRHAVARGGVERRVGFERVHQDLLRAGQRRHDGELAVGVDVEHRQVVEVHVVEGHAENLGAFVDVADHDMALHHALWMTRGARRVSDEQHLVGIDRIGAGLQFRVADRGAGRQHVVPASGVGEPLLAEEHDPPEFREGVELQRAVLALADIGHGVGQQGAVIHRTRPVDRDQHGTARLRQRIGHIVGPVARIERHDTGAHLGDCEHQEQPFRPVHHPDRDPLAGLDAVGDQALRQPVRLGLPVAERPTLTIVQKCFARAPFRRRVVQQGP